MNLLPTLFDLSAQLDIIIRARAAADKNSVRAALREADRMMLAYARERIVADEPSSLARCIINAAAGRAMGQPDARSRATSDLGASGAAPVAHKGRKATKPGKKAECVRPAQVKEVDDE